MLWFAHGSLKEEWSPREPDKTLLSKEGKRFLGPRVSREIRARLARGKSLTRTVAENVAGAGLEELVSADAVNSQSAGFASRC